MMQSDNWQHYLNYLLTDNGQFTLHGTGQKADTTIEYYKQEIGDKETIIKVGHLKNGRLITLDISNPKTPGHNAEQIDYFYENDFDQTKKIGLAGIGLPFSDVNRRAITSILKSGLKGIEKKYFVGDTLHFSKVVKPLGEAQEVYESTHHFAIKNFWVRLLQRLFKPKQQYTVAEVRLDKVFSGVR